LGCINISMELYLIHVFFISACVLCSYWSGHKAGAAEGRSQMVTDMIDRNLVTIDKLKKEYELH